MYPGLANKLYFMSSASFERLSAHCECLSASCEQRIVLREKNFSPYTSELYP